MSIQGGKGNVPMMANTPPIAARPNKRLCRDMNETPDGMTPRAMSLVTPGTKKFMKQFVPTHAWPSFSSESDYKSTTKQLANSLNQAEKHFKDQGKKPPGKLRVKLAALGKQSTGYIFQSRQIRDQAARMLEGKSPNRGHGQQYQMNMEIEREKREKFKPEQEDEWISSISQVRVQPPQAVLCKGIRTSKELELKYYLSNQVRSVADSIDECNVTTFTEKAKEFSAEFPNVTDVHAFYQSCGIIPANRWMVELEEGWIFAFRANECTRQFTGKRAHATLCTACEKLSKAVSSAVDRSLPLGFDGKPIPSSTTHKIIARHPKTMKVFLKQVSDETCKLKRQLNSALSRLGMPSEMIELGQQEIPEFLDETYKVRR